MTLFLRAFRAAWESLRMTMRLPLTLAMAFTAWWMAATSAWKTVHLGSRGRETSRMKGCSLVVRGFLVHWMQKPIPVGPSDSTGPRFFDPSV